MEMHDCRLLRSEILSAAVLSGVPSAVRQAKRLFSDWMSHDKSVPPNLREVVYTAGTSLAVPCRCQVMSCRSHETLGLLQESYTLYITLYVFCIYLYIIILIFTLQVSSTAASRSGSSAGLATTRLQFPLSGDSC